MKPFAVRNMAFLAAAALLTFAFTAATGAAEWGKLDRITFSRAVALPGVVLPAGSYTFEIANPNSSATVVRVTHSDTHRVYFAAFTENVRRPADLARGQMVTFGEASAGAPVPIAVWYPAAGEHGHRFLYQ